MKILIFSDTHLTHHFSKKKYIFLKKIIEGVDRVVINGDFWDSHLTDFGRFVNSPWKQLFPLLKKKKTVYIFGNHDPKQRSDHRTKLFSGTQVESYFFKTSSHKLLLLHGHQFDSEYDLIKLFVKMCHAITGNYVVASVFVPLQKFVFRHLGIKVYKIFFTRKNKRIKQLLKKKNSNHLVVTGHTHVAEKSLSEQYLNSGLVRFGIGQYIVVIDEAITLVDERY